MSGRLFLFSERMKSFGCPVLLSEGSSSSVAPSPADRSIDRDRSTSYPDWAERNEQLLKEIRDLLQNGFYEKDYLKRPDYVR